MDSSTGPSRPQPFYSHDLSDLLGDAPSIATNLAVALDLAARGFAVFPCKEAAPNRKGPYTWNGYKDAATDTEQIRAWWKRWPGAIIGLPTGETNGFAVVDLDRHKTDEDGFSALRSLGLDPDAVSNFNTATPANGKHLYFQHHPGLGNSDGHLPAGINLRAQGGYVIAPGSVMADGGRYVGTGTLEPASLPPFPAALMPPIRDGFNLSDLLDDAVPVDWDEVQRALPFISADCDHETWRNVGMALHAASDGSQDAFTLWDEWSATATEPGKYQPRIMRGQWRSFGKGQGIGIGTLFHVAAEHGWTRGPEINEDEFDDLPNLTFDTCGTDIDSMNKAAAKVLEGGKARVWHDGQLLAPEEFHKFFDYRTITVEKKEIPLTRIWWSHPRARRYENGLTFGPDKPGALNLWQGWAVEPSPTTSCERFLEHVRFVAGEHADWLLDWMAHFVQHPWERTGTAVVIRGLKGAGKDTIANYLAKLCPENRIIVADPRHILGNFNAHLERTLLLHIEEGSWAGDKQAESILKNRITAPEILIERKGIDPVARKNYARVFISSNSDWVVPATNDERRWFVLNVQEVRSSAYFDELYGEMYNGGPCALLAFLTSRAITHDLRKPPMTDALGEQVLETLTGVDRWWFDVLTSGRLPDRFEDAWSKVGCNDLYNDYASRDRYPVTQRSFGRKLTALCPGRRRLGGGNQGWFYLFPDIEKCRADFERVMKCSIEWETTVEDPLETGSGRANG